MSDEHFSGPVSTWTRRPDGTALLVEADVAKATLKCSVDADGNRRHEVQVDGKPRGFLDDYELREYCAHHIPASPVPAQRLSPSVLQLVKLVCDYGDAHGIKDFKCALVRACGEIPEAAALYEEARLEELRANMKDHGHVRLGLVG